MEQQRKPYTRLPRICEYCGKEFLGTVRAKYCCQSHNVMAHKVRTGKPSIWAEVKSLRAKPAAPAPVVSSNEIEDLKAQIRDLQKSVDDANTLIGVCYNHPGSLSLYADMLREFLVRHGQL